MLSEQVGRVVKITLNRPAVLNAQTAEMGDRLTEIIGDIGGRYGSVGAVVVTGAGRAFSAGGDLKGRGGWRSNFQSTKYAKNPLLCTFIGLTWTLGVPLLNL